MFKRIVLISFALSIAIVIAVYFVFIWQTAGQCGRFEGMAKKRDVQLALERWVKSNVESKKINLTNLIRSSGIYPGYYELNKEFDWGLLGIDPEKGQVRLIPGRNKHGEFDLSDIQSVSFTDRSRVSVLVRISTSRNYGIRDIKHITQITSSIAIYCAW
ncbi:MAG: hypothetical protein P8171_25065 [Candidatus Thiodiazotropha sp.]|jgi:hypothetical protein